MVRIRLYDLLQEMGLTQRDLHNKTGIREATISYMCNNDCKMLSIKNLDKMCVALNCGIEDIIKYIPDLKDIK